MRSWRIFRKSTIGVTAISAALAATVAAPPASASTWSTTLLNTTIVTDETPVPLVALPTLTLAAGHNKFLNSTYTVSNPNDFNVMQGARIRCRNMSNDNLYYSVFSTRNVTANGTSVIRVHWLFTAPDTGSYACTLWGHAVTSRGTNHRLNVTAGSLGVDDSTFPGGTEWRDTVGGNVPSGGSAYLLRKTWAATVGTRVGANADVELTNSGPAGNAGATADLTLYITQLGLDGTGCRAAVSVTKRISISADVHHDKVYLQHRDIAIDTSASCTTKFAIKVLVESVSGSPLVLEGSSGFQYSNGIAFSY